MSSTRTYVLALLAMGAGWGVTQPLSKIAVSAGHGFLGLIFWQMVVGALLLGAMLAMRRKSVPLTAATMRFAVLIAVIGTIIPNSTSYYSVVHLPAGVMAILIAAVPMISFPIALALGMDRFSPGRLTGLMFGLMGVMLIALPEGSLPSAAMVQWLPVALVAPFFYAVEANVVAKWGMAGMDAMQALFLASAMGAALTLPLALASGHWFAPWQSWGAPETALLVSSMTHALAYASYVWLAQRAGAVFASQCSYIVTGTGVVWAMVLLSERFSVWIWAAMAVMLLGLFLVQPRENVSQTA